MINKWASNEYVEHIIRKKDYVPTNTSTQQDDLFNAATQNTYSLANSKPANRPAEKGVTIRIGAPVEKESKKKESEEKPEGWVDPD